jgi:hypothetical protein
LRSNGTSNTLKPRVSELCGVEGIPESVSLTVTPEMLPFSLTSVYEDVMRNTELIRDGAAPVDNSQTEIMSVKLDVLLTSAAF